MTFREWLKDYPFLLTDLTHKFEDSDLDNKVIFFIDCWDTEGEIVVWLDLRDKPIYFTED
jgi:hypothetical protein